MQSTRCFLAAKILQRLGLALLLLLPGTAWAQATGAGAVQRSPAQVLNGTISSGAVSWSLAGSSWNSTGAGPLSDFVFGAQDQVYEDWW